MVENAIERIILGLDISTACTGVSIVSVDTAGNIKPMVVTHFRHKIPSKITGVESLFIKSNIFIDKLCDILEDKSLFIEGKSLITDIVIEEPLVSSNNKYTVATLLRYNGMVAYSVYNKLGVVPVFISSAEARLYGVPGLLAVRKYNKAGEQYPVKKIKKSLESGELVMFGAYPFDCAKKLILWNYISEKFPGINWVYKPDGELKTENFDASDSLICILGLLGQEKYSAIRPEITSYSDDGNGKIEYTYRFCGEEFNKTIEIE